MSAAAREAFYGARALGSGSGSGSGSGGDHGSLLQRRSATATQLWHPHTARLPRVTGHHLSGHTTKAEEQTTAATAAKLSWNFEWHEPSRSTIHDPRSSIPLHCLSLISPARLSSCDCSAAPPPPWRDRCKLNCFFFFHSFSTAASVCFSRRLSPRRVSFGPILKHTHTDRHALTHRGHRTHSALIRFFIFR